MTDAGGVDSWNPISGDPIHRPTSAPPVMELTQQLNAAELAKAGYFVPNHDSMLRDPLYFVDSADQSLRGMMISGHDPRMDEYHNMMAARENDGNGPSVDNGHYYSSNQIPPNQMPPHMMAAGGPMNGAHMQPHYYPGASSHMMQHNMMGQPYVYGPTFMAPGPSMQLEMMYRNDQGMAIPNNGAHNNSGLGGWNPYSHFHSPETRSGAPIYGYVPSNFSQGSSGSIGPRNGNDEKVNNQSGRQAHFAPPLLPISASPPDHHQEIWSKQSPKGKGRKNGRYSLSSDPALSSSTEDLLSLAGKPHLVKDNFVHTGSSASLEFGGSMSDLPNVLNQSPRSPRSPQPNRKQIKVQHQRPGITAVIAAPTGYQAGNNNNNNNKSVAVHSASNAMSGPYFMDSSSPNLTEGGPFWGMPLTSSGGSNEEFSGLLSGNHSVAHPPVLSAISHPEFVLGSGSPVLVRQPPTTANNAAPGSQNGSLCHYFFSGYCGKGDKCRYLHVEDQNSNANQTTNGDARRQRRSSGRNSTIHGPTPQAAYNSAPSNIIVPFSTSSTAAIGPSPSAVNVPLSSSSPPLVAAQSGSSSSSQASQLALASPARYSTMTIEECTGQIYQMCKDQYGCRFLQKKLDEDRTSATCEAIFTEILPEIVELMSDPFGNYLCQKLIEKCTPEQRLAIMKGVSGNLVQISKNMHGTRAVQKTIEQLGSTEEIRLVRDALKGSVVALIQDLNGNHVIQKCIHKLEPNDNQFIYDAVATHCVQVATHRHGCCVMQRCIDHSSDQQKLQLLNEVKNNALNLVQDQFGNYVVQYVLELGFESACEALAANLLGHLYYLSTQKFSSNVVEKCLKVGNAATVQFMSKELAEFQSDPKAPIFPNSPNEDPLVCLLQHPFGNYVVQTALQVSATKAPKEWNQIAARIKPHLPNLRSNTYVKRVQGLLAQPTKSADGSTSPTDSEDGTGIVADVEDKSTGDSIITTLNGHHLVSSAPTPTGGVNISTQQQLQLQLQQLQLQQQTHHEHTHHHHGGHQQGQGGGAPANRTGHRSHRSNKDRNSQEHTTTGSHQPRERHNNRHKEAGHHR